MTLKRIYSVLGSYPEILHRNREVLVGDIEEYVSVDSLVQALKEKALRHDTMTQWAVDNGQRDLEICERARAVVYETIIAMLKDK